MPDAIIVNDPFAKPSLEKEVVTIAYGAWDMALQLPNLGNAFTLSAIQSPANSTLASSAHRENSRKEEVKDGVIHSLRPGRLPAATQALCAEAKLDSRFAMEYDQTGRIRGSRTTGNGVTELCIHLPPLWKPTNH